VDFDELVCYSQTIILIILGIAYYLNNKNNVLPLKSKVEKKCPVCDYSILDGEVNYCAKCGNVLSHSEGLSLEK
jgi:hypothetical protein